MRLISNLELVAVGGGDYDFGTGSKGDQRNDSQKEADKRAEEAKRGCSGLGNAGGCSKRVDLLNFQLKTDEFTICIATGGKEGPSDCGEKPKK
jgi:hypothetical protein